MLGLDIYAEQLINEGIVSAEDVKTVSEKYEQICEEAFELAKKETHIKVDWNYTYLVNILINIIYLKICSTKIGSIHHGLDFSKEKILFVSVRLVSKKKH